MMLVGARAHFCAGHKLPQHKEVHGHSYEVWVYVREGMCAEALQSSVQAACGYLDHRLLNDVICDASMEEIARFIADKILGCERIIIRRPVEGLTCEWSP